MKKLILFAFMAVGLAFTADADVITVNTSCGKTVYVDSGDFPDMVALLAEVNSIEARECGDNSESEDQGDMSENP